MNFRRSTAQSLSTIFILPLLALSLHIEVATGQQEPAGGPSGISHKRDESPAGRSTYEGPVTARRGVLGLRWGEDIPLPCSICHRLGGTNEPAVAINPQRPNNIAVASLFELRVSTDNGATFSAPTAAQVPAGFQLGGDPSLAFDSRGGSSGPTSGAG